MTYWNDDGKYQKAYNKLWKKLVPARGEAETVRGELLRAASKLYYDLFNNGLGNYNVLECHWRFIKSRASGLGIASKDIDDINAIFVVWRQGYQGKHVWVDYDELVRLGLPGLLEKLISAVVVYSAIKEIERG